MQQQQQQQTEKAQMQSITNLLADAPVNVDWFALPPDVFKTLMVYLRYQLANNPLDQVLVLVQPILNQFIVKLKKNNLLHPFLQFITVLNQQRRQQSTIQLQPPSTPQQQIISSNVPAATAQVMNCPPISAVPQLQQLQSQQLQQLQSQQLPSQQSQPSLLFIQQSSSQSTPTTTPFQPVSHILVSSQGPMQTPLQSQPALQFQPSQALLQSQPAQTPLQFQPSQAPLQSQPAQTLLQSQPTLQAHHFHPLMQPPPSPVVTQNFQGQQQPLHFTTPVAHQELSRSIQSTPSPQQQQQQQQQQQESPSPPIASNSSEGLTAKDYNDLLHHYKLDQLKNMCKTYGLKVSGTKSELATRIVMYQKNAPGASSIEPQPHKKRQPSSIVSDTKRASKKQKLSKQQPELPPAPSSSLLEASVAAPSITSPGNTSPFHNFFPQQQLSNQQQNQALSNNNNSIGNNAQQQQDKPSQETSFARQQYDNGELDNFSTVLPNGEMWQMPLQGDLSSPLSNPSSAPDSSTSNIFTRQFSRTPEQALSLAHAQNGANKFSRNSHSANMYKNCMIVFGGVLPDGKYTDQVIMFDTENSMWKPLDCRGDIPKPRKQHSSCIFQDSMIMFGGCGEDNEMFNDMYTLDLKESPHEWTLLQPNMFRQDPEFVPQPIFAHSLCLLGNEILVFGGCNIFYDNPMKIVVYDDLWSYNMKSKKWSRKPKKRPWPLPRCNHGAVICNNKLYICGGTNYVSQTNFTSVNDLWEYDPIEAVWTELIADTENGTSNQPLQFSPTTTSGSLKSMFHPKLVTDGNKFVYIVRDDHSDKETRRSILRFTVDSSRTIEECSFTNIPQSNANEEEKSLPPVTAHSQQLAPQYYFDFCRVSACMIDSRIIMFGGFAFDGPYSHLGSAVVVFHVDNFS